MILFKILMIVSGNSQSGISGSGSSNKDIRFITKVYLKIFLKMHFFFNFKNLEVYI